MSVFVSYRRDDAAGHAGRLCDDLGDRLGHDAVFHDVDSIAPGADFLEAIRRAVASADTVLVVIGPDWATLPNQHGTPRLSEPDDVVRMEIAVALRAGKPIIPVLVGGASMPIAAELPTEIAALARHNAVELRPNSWDDDTAELLEVLDLETTQPAPTVGRRRRRGRLILGLVVVGLVATGAAFVLLDDDLRTSSSQPPATASDGATSATAGTTTPTSGSAVALALPINNRTILGGPDAGLVSTVDAASLAPQSVGVDAELGITFENRSPYDMFLLPTDVQLLADGTAVNPVQNLGVLVAGRSAESMTFDFPLEDEPTELIVQVHAAGELAEVPLTGPRTAPAIAPVVVGSIAPADIGTLALEFGAPEIDTYSDRHLLGIPIHVLNNDLYDSDISDRHFRLLIDGSPRAPVNTVNELVPAGASIDTTVWWEIPDGAPSLTLRIERGDATADRPVTQQS